ncbi:Kinesin motor domain [Dillenia turbinata]|uniref:Kinesin motor domain n=1 Tax=Dillenia turbinata TaxID=194707 RepID=A0AAN8ZR50_9MAGN
MKSNTETSETRFLGSLSASSIRKFLPRSISNTSKSTSLTSKSRSGSENAPPADPNIQANAPQLSSANPNPSKSPSKSVTFQKEIPKSETRSESRISPDPAVKVVVRIRPEKDGDRTVKKVSPDSLLVGDRRFSFDSVLDSNSNQEEIFQQVGVPLVKNALCGYNTSVFSYGQTGSGKTYTMWGPPSAMLEGQYPNSELGIGPRIFQMLFSEIQKEKENCDGKQINYQCRCSFLEVYNDQIGDLLDPSQRNLEIKDDPKSGFYVENLTEEYVNSYDDVTQILIKGLSSRKVGATSINSKSSRSHIVFTCIIESWCKDASSKSKYFSSSKSSRISLIDLAGMDRNKIDDSSKQYVREDRNVRKSLAQLGCLVNILAEDSQSGKHNDVPYGRSVLTRLMRETLGGNAKLTVICAVSSDSRNAAETLSTLRFGQRAKSIHNEPVINEISEDDVNDLNDQIRQLKEELIKARSSVYDSVGSKNGSFQRQNARETLNQLRKSLNRSLILPQIENNSEEEIHADEEDIKELHLHLKQLQNSCEEGSKDHSDNRDSASCLSMEECDETDLASEHDISCLPETDDDEEEFSSVKSLEEELPGTLSASGLAIRSSLSITSCRQSTVLQEPTLSESPKIANCQRKSVAFSSGFLENQKPESLEHKSNVLQQSHRCGDSIRSSLQSSQISPRPTDSLAASLHRGLQIIDHHQKNTSSRSSIAFSFEHLTLMPCQAADKANSSAQTPPEEEKSSPVRMNAPFICASCRQKAHDGSDEIDDSLKTWILAVNETGNSDISTDKVPKEALLEATGRKKELEQVCKEQAAKIEQLNHLVEEYKHQREMTEKHDQDIKSLCLEALKDEVALEDTRNDECHSLNSESKLTSHENRKEVIEESCDIKEMQEGLDNGYREKCLDENEKAMLLKEIQSLRSQLQSKGDVCLSRSVEKLRSSSTLSRSLQLRKSGLNSQVTGQEELEIERQRWMEMESDWILLTDELRIDLESSRRRAEKVETELKLEKQCTEELDDALHRAVLGHARIVEHYADLQEKYNELVEKHRRVMEGIAEVKRAVAKAGAKGGGSRYAKALAAELSALRKEKEKERDFLKRENTSLKIQLRDTADAVHAAGELLVRLREAENVASVAEENYSNAQQENERLRKQVEKLKRKHKMEMETMKQYLAESRLPESALRPHYEEDTHETHSSFSPFTDDDQAWRAEFGPIYQERI